jgi:hypothetical protein
MLFLPCGSDQNNVSDILYLSKKGKTGAGDGILTLDPNLGNGPNGFSAIY